MESPGRQGKRGASVISPRFSPGGRHGWVRHGTHDDCHASYSASQAKQLKLQPLSHLQCTNILQRFDEFFFCRRQPQCNEIRCITHSALSCSVDCSAVVAIALLLHQNNTDFCTKNVLRVCESIWLNSSEKGGSIFLYYVNVNSSQSPNLTQLTSKRGNVLLYYVNNSQSLNMTQFTPKRGQNFALLC